MVTERFQYSRQQFLINLFLLLALLVFAPLTLLSIGGIAASILIGFIVLIAVITFLFGISPMITAHTLNEEHLILRQGYYFRAVIPVGNLKSVKRIEIGPRRTGTWTGLFGSVLYVTTRRHDLIEVELRHAQAFPWALWKRADVVVFDTLDNSHFLRRMREMEITPSSPTL
jgi:hypothetical protein